MSEALSGSVIQKGLKLKDVFFEVKHNETLGLRRKGQLRLFHMVMHSNKFFSDDLQAVLYRNLARYVFSRAKLEDFKQNDELETAVAQAMRVMRENGDADSEGTGNGLGEILIYAFLEEMLHAPKIMSRVELYTELAQFKSECKGIHLLSPEDGEGGLKYQLVFGASHIIGVLQDAIDYAFDAILKIESHANREIVMVQKTAMDRMVNGKEAERLKEIIIPNPGQSSSYDTAYGVFLGYSLGLKTEERDEDFETLAKQKMEYDIRYYAPYIAKKIKDNGLDNHSFYFYVVPFNDAEQDKLVDYYAGAVLSSTGNFLGLKNIESIYREPTAMDRLFSTLSDIYLAVPGSKEMRFFQVQKNVYDHLSDECFSYSAPTSMGKSFVMRMFIKAQVASGAKMNFALIVPTKALINEVRSEIIKNDLNDLLEAENCHVISSAGDMALEIHPDHNFILVMTPERLLYLLNDKENFRLDYLFIDEAHKMTGRNSRAPFYYSVVDELCRREQKPHFIFASPNIPNPHEYLRLIATGQYDRRNAVASTFSPVAQFKFLVNLKRGQISIYNDHLKTQEYVCALHPLDSAIPLMVHYDGVFNGKQSRTIAYFNSKDKAINAARSFERSRQKLHDKDLDELASDVRKLVHGDYFLADLLEKGIAYHIGYLPSSIRIRIEKLFKEEKITAMFCTSTLVEGVNLPADNLFITSYYNGRGQMSDIDFRNLIGRVGRIQFNLCGNVFLVSDETKNNKQEVYVEKLKNDIEDQKLSVVQDLKPKHKKHIVETLLSGSSKIMPYNTESQKQPEEEYIMMRKFGLILLRDIIKDRDSLVRREFAEYLKPGDEQKIRQLFAQSAHLIDNDINISLDQTRRLQAAIRADDTLKYPPHNADGSFDADVVRDFLIRLGDIFDWKRYEFNTLGKCDEDGDYTKLRWYAVILAQWMEGKGLNRIMRRAVSYQEQHPEKFWINKYTKTYYFAESLEHRNIVFANTLEVIENIILFSISNYFLRFSTEYKKIRGEGSLATGNWYEYVEYGTTNDITIQLQRYGFSRESATYIRDHQDDYIILQDDGTIKIRLDKIEKCPDSEVQRELPDVHFNTPELFDDETITQ